MTTAVAPNTLSYAFDPYGNSPANKIVNEYHIITPDNSRKFNLLIPLKAPFFATSFQATLTSGATPLPLVEGVHFQFAFEHMAASRKCSKPIYGAIIFVDESLSGTIRIDQYQTLGGVWTLDEAGIAEIMANTLYNPRVTTWEKINGLPYEFPTIDHEHNVEDLGMSSVVAKLDEIKAVLNGDPSGGTLPTLAELGLDLVPNLPLADDPTATAAVSRAALMSPMGVRLAITALVLNDFNAFKALRNNPNQVTAAQTGAYTQAQVNSLLAGYLETDGKAADSLLFDGYTRAQIAAQVLTGTAANSTLFSGLTVEQLQALILMGTAANATHFAGLTLEELLAQIELGAASTDIFAPQVVVPASANAGVGLDYVQIADCMSIVDGVMQDGYLVVSGGVWEDGKRTPLWLLRYSNRLGAGNGDYLIEACDLTNSGIPANFGLRIDIISIPAEPKVQIWMRGPRPLGDITVTSLNRDTIIPITSAEAQITAPDQITWYTVAQGVWNSQRLEDKTLAEVATYILGGTAANAAEFSGMTAAEFAAYVLEGTAAAALTAGDSAELGGVPAASYALESEIIDALAGLKTYLET